MTKCSIDALEILFIIIIIIIITMSVNDLRNPSVSTATFGRSFRHTCSLPINTFSALAVSHVMRYINLHVRYLLIYLLITMRNSTGLPVGGAASDVWSLAHTYT